MRGTRTRLRWYKKDTIIISEPLIVGSSTVRSVIDIETLSYKITDIAGSPYYACGKADSLDKVKKDSKTRLIGMGAKFYDEVRLSEKK